MLMGNILFHIIKKLDFMGDPMNFKINKIETFKTTFGGFLSLFLYMSFLTLFIFLGSDIINKENPDGYEKKEFYKGNEGNLSLKNNSFIIGVTIEDFYLNKIDVDTIGFFSFELGLFNYSQPEGQRETVESLPAVSCDKVNYPSHLDKGIHNVSKYVCPDLSNIKLTDSLYGSWDTTISYRIYIKLSPCNKEIGVGKICKDVDKIREVFEKEMIILSMITPKVEYSITNYDNPIKTFLTNKYRFIGSKQYVFEDLKYSSYELHDDTGVIFSNENTTKTWGLFSEDLHFDIRDDRKKPEKFMIKKDFYLYWGEVSFLNSYPFYFRSYTKVLDIIGNVYGISEILVFVVMFFYKIYSKIRLNSYLCMRLLFLEEDESIDFEGKRKTLSGTEKILSRKNIYEYFSSSTALKKKNETEGDEDKLRRQKTIPLGNFIRKPVHVRASTFNSQRHHPISELENDNLKGNNIISSQEGFIQKEIESENNNHLIRSKTCFSKDLKTKENIMKDTLEKLDENEKVNKDKTKSAIMPVLIPPKILSDNSCEMDYDQSYKSYKFAEEDDINSQLDKFANHNNSLVIENEKNKKGNTKVKHNPLHNMKNNRRYESKSHKNIYKDRKIIYIDGLDGNLQKTYKSNNDNRLKNNLANLPHLQIEENENSQNSENSQKSSVNSQSIELAIQEERDIHHQNGSLSDQDVNKNDHNDQKKDQNDPKNCRKSIGLKFSQEKKDKIKKLREDIRPILEHTINKFRAFRNSMTFTGIFYAFSSIFPTNNGRLRNNYDIIFEYSEKLQKQFDIFYYMQQHKKLNIIEGLLFNPIEKKLINLVSKKYYKVSSEEQEATSGYYRKRRSTIEKKELIKDLENNEEIIEFVLDNKDCDIDSKEEQLIKYLIA